MSESKPVTMTVLFVDDEPNILKAIKRLLYKQDFTLLLANSGAEALEILKTDKVDLIVSDMKMPQMNGAELLEQVSTHYPETYRIVLTGYADMESTVAAVNRGKIHRYLNKPWNNQELLEAIETGLEQVKLKHENARLKQLTIKQNTLLKELNHNLEEKVALRTKQIQVALQKLEHNNRATHRMLFNFISVNPHIDGGFARNVSGLTKAIAKRLDLSAKQIREISLAGLLCEIGLIGLEPKLIQTPFQSLNYQEQQAFLGQINIVQSMLAPAAQLAEESSMIEMQYEQIDGAGPHKKIAPEIPIGSKIIAIARDFWRYQSGRILEHKIDAKAAQAEMKKHRGTKYDSEILDLFLSHPELIDKDKMEKTLAVDELEAGMVLAQNLFNENHMLLLPEGHSLTDENIAKLKHLDQTQDANLNIHIQ